MQDLAQSGPWAQGSYPQGRPSTPGQTALSSNNLSHTHSQSSSQQQQALGGSAQNFSQSSQQSLGPMSPQTPYSNQNQQLTKNSSISSIRDALLSGTNQLTPGDQNSPITPTVKPIPDGQIMSPMSVSRQDSQLSTSESISSQDRLSQQQPSLRQTEINSLSETQDLNSLGGSVGVGAESGGKPDSLGMNTASPSLKTEHSSPSMNQAVSLAALWSSTL